MCSFLVWINACLNYREFDLEGDLVGVPHTWYLSAQSFIRLLKLAWREYDIVVMNEWKKKCVGLQWTWVSDINWSSAFNIRTIPTSTSSGYQRPRINVQPLINASQTPSGWPCLRLQYFQTQTYRFLHGPSRLRWSSGSFLCWCGLVIGPSLHGWYPEEPSQVWWSASERLLAA